MRKNSAARHCTYTQLSSLYLASAVSLSMVREAVLVAQAKLEPCLAIVESPASLCPRSLHPATTAMQNVDNAVVTGVLLFVGYLQSGESADPTLRGFLGAPPLSQM